MEQFSGKSIFNGTAIGRIFFYSKDEQKVRYEKIENVDAEVERIKETLGISYSTILPFSSERKIYIDNVWKEIEKYIEI